MRRSKSNQTGNNEKWIINNKVQNPKRTRPNPLKYKKVYLMRALGEETAIKAVVGSIVAFCRLKNAEESGACGYAIHNVRLQLSSFTYYKSRLTRSWFRIFAAILHAVRTPPTR